MDNDKKDTLLKFCLIGIPVILIIVAICYSVISKNSGFTPGKNNDENPYEYSIQDLKKVDPKLVKYREVPKVPVSFKSPSTIATRKSSIYAAGLGTYEDLAKDGVIKELQISVPPNSMSVSNEGNIAFCFNKEILYLKQYGDQIFHIDKFSEKALLTSIAVEGDYIYVADAGRRMILQFDKKGELKREIGKEDKAKGIDGFIVPSANFDIIPGGDGSIWAVNPGRLQIENFTSDGRLRSSWKASVIGIEGFSGCCNPAHIALLPNGDFVTAEKNIVRVKVYDATGKFKCVVATPQQFAEDAKILDIATDSEGKIYVLDSKTKGIRVFVEKDR